MLNEDGSLNSAERPARAGQVLQIFATGYPALEAAIRSGGVPTSGTVIHTVRNPRIWVGGSEMQVLFSGASPEFPGMWQINATIPVLPPAAG